MVFEAWEAHAPEFSVEMYQYNVLLSGMQVEWQS